MSDPDEDSTMARTMLPPPTDKPTASLYVGDLHPDVTEAVLFQKFSTAGPVSSIRVCRDMTTRRSLGYAYVNFQSPEDAQKALDTMNFDVIYGQAIRIMWQERDPTLRKSGVGNIFIKNLDSSIDNKALHDTFSKFGNILSCKVTTDRHSIDSTGFAFVHFQTEEAAQSAIYRMNGTMLRDKKLFVGKFLSRQERVTTAQNDRATNFTNVYIKDIPAGFNDEQLYDLCQPFGKVISAKVIHQAGSSSRLGIVSCEDHTSAEAIKRLVGQSQRDPSSWDDLLKQGYPTQKTDTGLHVDFKMSQMKQQHPQQAAVVSNADRISEQQLRPEHRTALPQGSQMQQGPKFESNPFTRAQEFYAGPQSQPYNPMHTGAMPPMVYPNQTLPGSYCNYKLPTSSLPHQQVREPVDAYPVTAQQASEQNTANILSQMALAQAAKQSCSCYMCTLLARQGMKQSDSVSCEDHISVQANNKFVGQPQLASPSLEGLKQRYLTQLNEGGLGHFPEGLHAQGYGYPFSQRLGDTGIPNAYHAVTDQGVAHEWEMAMPMTSPLPPMPFHQKPESTFTAHSPSALAQGFYASPQVFWHPTAMGYVPQLVYPDPVPPYQANLESSQGMHGPQHPWGRQQVEAPVDTHPVTADEHNLAEMLRQMALTGPSRFPSSTGGTCSGATCSSATCSSHSHSHTDPQAEESDARLETCHEHPDDHNALDNVFANQGPSRR